MNFALSHNNPACFEKPLVFGGFLNRDFRCIQARETMARLKTCKFPWFLKFGFKTVIGIDAGEASDERKGAKS